MTIIQSHSTSPVFNLAAEEYLFSQQEDDLLFLYVNDPSVIIGCNQVLRNEVNARFCEANNIQVLRRVSGGGAVYHDRGNLNYCFISKRKDAESSLSADFLLPVISALSSLGIPVVMGKRKDLWLPGELKISGTASHIGSTRKLQHGTLLYSSNLQHLKTALLANAPLSTAKGTQSVRSQVGNLSTYLLQQRGTAPSANEFFTQFFDCMEFYFRAKIRPFSCAVDNEVFLEYKLRHTNPEWVNKK